MTVEKTPTPFFCTPLSLLAPSFSLPPTMYPYFARSSLLAITWTLCCHVGTAALHDSKVSLLWYVLFLIFVCSAVCQDSGPAPTTPLLYRNLCLVRWCVGTLVLRPLAVLAVCRVDGLALATPLLYRNLVFVRQCVGTLSSCFFSGHRSYGRHLLVSLSSH